MGTDRKYPTKNTEHVSVVFLLLILIVISVTAVSSIERKAAIIKKQQTLLSEWAALPLYACLNGNPILQKAP